MTSGLIPASARLTGHGAPGELEEDRFEAGITNVQGEERRLGVREGVEYPPDVARVCHVDRDVPVVVLDRLEAHRPDDPEGRFVGGLQGEDQVLRVGLYDLLGRAHR